MNFEGTGRVMRQNQRPSATFKRMDRSTDIVKASEEINEEYTLLIVGHVVERDVDKADHYDNLINLPIQHVFHFVP